MDSAWRPSSARRYKTGRITETVAPRRLCAPVASPSCHQAEQQRVAEEGVGAEGEAAQEEHDHCHFGQSAGDTDSLSPDASVELVIPRGARRTRRKSARGAIARQRESPTISFLVSSALNGAV